MHENREISSTPWSGVVSPRAELPGDGWRHPLISQESNEAVLEVLLHFWLTMLRLRQCSGLASGSPRIPTTEMPRLGADP
jgi:hypothetical protein